MNTSILIHQSVLFAVFGAFAIQVLSLLELKGIPKPNRPDLGDFFFWLPFLLLPILGGGLALAYIYPDESLKPLVAINIGVSAPLILRSMANMNPFERGGRDPGDDA